MEQKFEEWKKDRFPHHHYEPVWSQMLSSDWIEDAFKAGYEAGRTLPDEVSDLMEAAAQVRENIASMPLETQKIIDHNGWLTALRNNLDACQHLRNKGE